MFALISPNEKQGQYQRIAELADVPFDVAGIDALFVEASKL